MEKIWLQSYPDGVPAEIGPFEDNSLAELIERACRRYADKVAFLSMGCAMRYDELDRLATEFAGWLQSLGLQKGSRVALMMPNLLQYPVCLFGTLRAGCVVVNCNPLYTPRELEHQLKDSGAEVIVVVENFAHTVEPVLPHTCSAPCDCHAHGRDARHLQGCPGELRGAAGEKTGATLAYSPSHQVVGCVGGRTAPRLQAASAGTRRPGLPAIHGGDHRGGKGGHVESRQHRRQRHAGFCLDSQPGARR